VLITRFAGSAPWEASYGYSRVVIAGNWAITAGTTATGLDGVLHPGDAYRQTVAAFTIALDALKRAGVTAEQVVRTRMYVTDITSQAEVGGRTTSYSAKYGRWRPWSRSRGWPIHHISSRSKSRPTSETEMSPSL
jgi:enamine deaminase RidA (YjgF/YER057c/UK114 family)